MKQPTHDKPSLVIAAAAGSTQVKEILTICGIISEKIILIAKKGKID